MSLDTNNLFAEKTIGPIDSEISSATTVKGLVKQKKRQDAVAEAMKTPEKQPSKLKRVAVGGALAATALIAAHATGIDHKVADRVTEDRIFHPEQGNPTVVNIDTNGTELPADPSSLQITVAPSTTEPISDGVNRTPQE